MLAQLDEAAVIRAIRVDQEAQTTFPEFLRGIWEAGVTSYDVDLAARTVNVN